MLSDLSAAPQTELGTDAKGPVFVVGMNGSGTTMLLDHLNSHSQLYGFPDETRILPHYLLARKKYGDLEQDSDLLRLWRDMCAAFPFWKVNGQASIPLPEDWRERPRTPAAIFDYVLGVFAAREGKTRWCEKTPMYARHIELLHTNFPNAHFIHMIRDGRDCAASFQRRWGYEPRCTMQRWKRTIRAAREQGRALGDRYHEIRFEELTTSPERCLREICSFLSVEFEEKLLISMRTGERMRSLESNSILPNSGRYRDYFSAREIARLESIGGHLLSELGYESVEIEGDVDVNALYLWLRQSWTQISRLKDIRRRAKGSQSPWQLIRGRIISGINYRRSDGY